MPPPSTKTFEETPSAGSPSTWSSVPQILGSAAIGMIPFLSGLSVPISSIIIPTLDNISEEESSWLASVSCLGIIIGSIAGCFYTDVIGRRKSLIIDSIIFFASFLTFALSNSITVMCVGRFIGGFAFGTMRCSCFVFTGELSRPEIRGLTNNINMLAYVCGFSSLMLVGALFHWRTVMYLISAPCLIAAISLSVIHESPVWLLRNNKREEARASLIFYRGSFYNPDPELKEMEDSITNINQKENILTKIKMTGSPLFYKPFSYLLIMFVLMEWSSFPVLGNYLVTIFQLTTVPVDPYVGGFIASTSRVVGSLLASVILLRCPRRPLYLVSTITLCLSLAGLATFCYLSQIYSISHLNYIPLISVIFIYLSFSIGFGSCTCQLLGEILPPATRSLGNGLILVAEFSSAFICLKMTPFFLGNIGVHGLFWVFSLVVLFQIFFAFFFMPETRGKSLTEIQKLYR